MKLAARPRAKHRQRDGVQVFFSTGGWSVDGIAFGFVAYPDGAWRVERQPSRAENKMMRAGKRIPMGKVAFRGRIRGPILHAEDETKVTAAAADEARRATLREWRRIYDEVFVSVRGKNYRIAYEREAPLKRAPTTSQRISQLSDGRFRLLDPEESAKFRATIRDLVMEKPFRTTRNLP
jgi:hypothetical protein